MGLHLFLRKYFLRNSGVSQETSVRRHQQKNSSAARIRYPVSLTPAVS